MTLVPIHNVGAVGVVKDRPGHTIPPEAWTDSANIRFRNKNAVRFAGHTQVYGTPLHVPAGVFYVPGLVASFWFYFSKLKASVWDGSVHTDITRIAGDYTAVEERDWNFTLLGGVPIANNGNDTPQYWPTFSIGTKLLNLANFPASTKAKVVRAFSGHLVALNITEAGTLRPHMVWWSHKTDPGTIPSSWDHTDPTKDAGRTELTDAGGGVILDGLPLGNQFIIYKGSSTHAMRVIGGNDIFGFDMLRGSSGILSTRCVCQIEKGNKHFVVSEDDVLTHVGGRDAESVLDEKVKLALFAEMDSTNYLNSFCFDNSAEQEAWFVYPTAGNVRPNKSLVWNYKTGVPQFRDFDGMSVDVGTVLESLSDTWDGGSGAWDGGDSLAWSEQTRRKIVIGSPANTKLFKLDDGFAFGATAPTAFLERIGLAVIGLDRQRQPKVDFDKRKLLSRIWPLIKGTAAVSVRVGAQEELEGAVVWQASKVYDPVQKYLDFEANGRLLAVRFESVDNLPWQLEGYGVEITILGTH